MAYTHPSLFRVGGTDSQAPSLWMYTTPDAQTVVRAAGYFNDASADLTINDVIIVASATGGTPVMTITYVNANAAGVVDTVDGLTITGTDTD